MLQLTVCNFRPGSHILIEGERAKDYFFIIQKGSVDCYSESATDVIPEDRLGPGDFVGVVSCMSGHSETKTAVAKTEVTCIVVKKAQYPELIVNNTPIAMKIIRAFARDMRIVNDQLTRITTNKVNVDSPEQIFPVAEFYENAGYTDIAVYAYYQYIKECATGINVDIAKKKFLKMKPRSGAVYFESDQSQIRNYPRNTMIFSESQHGSDMFIIQSGTVRIGKIVDEKEVVFALLKKGDMFGEMALLENKPRSACAIAHEECTLMVINKLNFEKMVSTQPQMISKLTNILSDRLWAMFRQLTNTQLTEIREKMVDMVALQLEKNRVQYMKGTVYNSDMSATDIFKLCGIPIMDYNMAGQQLMRDQCIKVVGGKITVPDVDELFRQAAFYRKQNAKKRKANNG